MAGLVPAIHAVSFTDNTDVDARDKPGHDGAKDERPVLYDCS